MTRVPIAQRDKAGTLTTVAIFVACGVIPWVVVVEAGSVTEALASESRPFLLLAAILASPFGLLIAFWALWRTFRWKGLSIFIREDQLWLANRMRPLPLVSGATFELSDPVTVLPGFGARPHLAMVGCSRIWKYPLPNTIETPHEIVDRLQHYVDHRQPPPRAPR